MTKYEHIGIIRIDHIGIVAKNDDGLHNLLSSWGMELTKREYLSVQDVNEYEARQPLELAFIQVVSSGGPGSPIENFLERRGPGIHHIALEVGDLPYAMRILQGRGFNFTTKSPIVRDSGYRAAFLRPEQTFGVLFEFVERVGKE